MFELTPACLDTHTRVLVSQEGWQDGDLEGIVVLLLKILGNSDR